MCLHKNKLPFKSVNLKKSNIFVELQCHYKLVILLWFDINVQESSALPLDIIVQYRTPVYNVSNLWCVQELQVQYD